MLFQKYAFSTVHTKTFEKDRIARCDVTVELYVHATNTRACTYDVIVFHSAVFERPHLYDM